MNNKNNGTYSFALLMSLFLCSIEMNAMQLPRWAKSTKPVRWADYEIRDLYAKKIEPVKKQVEKDLRADLDITEKALQENNNRLKEIEQVKKETLHNENLPPINFTLNVLNRDKRELEKHIEAMNKKLNNPEGYLESLNWNVLRGNKGTLDLTKTYYDEIEEYKKHIETLSPNRNAEGGYNDRVSFLGYVDQDFDNMIMHKIDKINEEIKNEGKEAGDNYVGFRLAEALGLKYGTAPMYSMTEPTLWQKIKKFFGGKSSSTFGFSQSLPPQQMEQEKIQQASMRERNFPPTPAVLPRWRKGVQKWYARAAQQPPLTEKQKKQIERYTATPGNRFIEPY